MLGTTLSARAIDDVLLGSFPASDPPAWSPGIARVAPPIHEAGGQPAGGEDSPRGARDVPPARPADAPDPGPAAPTFVQSLVSLVGVAGFAVLVPFAILAIGAPVARVIRGAIELAAWLLSFAV
jgi:hypothetical protein